MSSNCITLCMRVPNGFGCAQFGRPSVTDRKKWNCIRLSTTLERAYRTAVNDLIAEAVSGSFPSLRNVHVQCTCQPVSSMSSILFRKTLPSRISWIWGISPANYSMRCHISLSHILNLWDPTWGVVVGYEIDKHTVPTTYCFVGYEEGGSGMRTA